MRNVILEVPKEFISDTKMMNDYQRKNAMRAADLISDSLWWGYGVYGGARVVDGTHVELMVGETCD